MIGFIIVGLMFINRIGTQIALIDQRLGSAEADLRDMANGVRQLAAGNMELARIDERVSAMDRRLDDMAGRLNKYEKYRGESK